MIDDGSTDGTRHIAEKLAKQSKYIRVIHQKNLGYGRTILRGIIEAKKEFVTYISADGQYLLSDMKQCLSLTKTSDLVLGVRDTRFDYSLYRYFLSYAYLIILRALFNLRYDDINWVSIWRTSEVKKIYIMSRSVFVLAEIVIRFQRKGLKMDQAICTYRRRQGGKAKNAKLIVALETLKDLLFLRFLFSIEKKL